MNSNAQILKNLDGTQQGFVNTFTACFDRCKRVLELSQCEKSEPDIFLFEFPDLSFIEFDRHSSHVRYFFNLKTYEDFLLDEGRDFLHVSAGFGA